MKENSVDNFNYLNYWSNSSCAHRDVGRPFISKLNGSMHFVYNN